MAHYELEEADDTLQRMVDGLFASGAETVTKFDVELRAEIEDVCAELREIIELLPNSRYTRQRLCDQLNSILCGHGWAIRFGTVA